MRATKQRWTGRALRAAGLATALNALCAASSVAGPPDPPAVGESAQAAIDALAAYDAMVGAEAVEQAWNAARRLASEHTAARNTLAEGTDLLTGIVGLGQHLLDELAQRAAPDGAGCHAGDDAGFWLAALYGKHGLAGRDPTWRKARRHHGKEEWRSIEDHRAEVGKAIETHGTDNQSTLVKDIANGPWQPKLPDQWGQWTIGTTERQDGVPDTSATTTVVEEAQASVGNDELEGPRDNSPHGRRDSAERAGIELFRACQSEISAATHIWETVEEFHCRWHGDRTPNAEGQCRSRESSFGPMHWLELFKEERLAACYTSEYCVTLSGAARGTVRTAATTQPSDATCQNNPATPGCNPQKRYEVPLDTVAPEVAAACESDTHYEGTALVRKDAAHQEWLAPRCNVTHDRLGEQRVKGHAVIWQSEIGGAARRSRGLKEDLDNAITEDGKFGTAMTALKATGTVPDLCLASVLDACASTYNDVHLAKSARPHIPLDPWRLANEAATPACLKSGLNAAACASLIQAP